MHSLFTLPVQFLRKATESLRTVVITSVLLGISVPAAVSIYLERNRLALQFSQQLESDLKKTTRLFADGVKESVWQMSTQDANAIVAAAFADERILEIAIQDVQGGVFLTKKREGDPGIPTISHQVTLEQDGKNIGSVKVFMNAKANQEQLDDALSMSVRLVAQLLIGALILIGFFLQTRVIRPLQRLVQASDRLAQGDLDSPILNIRSDEIGRLARSMDATRQVLAGHIRNVSELAEAAAEMQKAQDYAALGASLMAWLSPRIGLGQGSFYVADPGRRQLTLAYAYARPSEIPLPQHIAYGEGLLGQCAIDQTPLFFKDPEKIQLRIQSGLGNASPSLVIIQPLVANQRLLGVVELALYRKLESEQLDLFQRLLPTICLCIEVLGRNSR